MMAKAISDRGKGEKKHCERSRDLDRGEMKEMKFGLDDVGKVWATVLDRSYWFFSRIPSYFVLCVLAVCGVVLRHRSIQLGGQYHPIPFSLSSFHHVIFFFDFSLLTWFLFPEVRPRHHVSLYISSLLHLLLQIFLSIQLIVAGRNIQELISQTSWPLSTFNWIAYLVHLLIFFFLLLWYSYYSQIFLYPDKWNNYRAPKWRPFFVRQLFFRLHNSTICMLFPLNCRDVKEEFEN